MGHLGNGTKLMEYKKCRGSALTGHNKSCWLETGEKLGAVPFSSSMIPCRYLANGDELHTITERVLALDSVRYQVLPVRDCDHAAEAAPRRVRLGLVGFCIDLSPARVVLP